MEHNPEDTYPDEKKPNITATPEDPSSKESAQHLNLKVEYPEGEFTNFKIKRVTKMEKLMKAFFTKHGGLQPGNVRFLTQEGVRVQPTDTANTLNAEEGDVIEVLSRQDGGKIPNEDQFSFGLSDSSASESLDQQIDQLIEQQDTLIQQQGTLIQKNDTFIQKKHMLIQQQDTLSDCLEQQIAQLIVQYAEVLIQKREVLIQKQDTLTQKQDMLFQQQDTLIQQHDTLIQQQDTFIQQQDTLSESLEQQMAELIEQYAGVLIE